MCEYFAYVNAFIPTVTQPYPLSDTDYFKQKDKDAQCVFFIGDL